MYLLLVLIWIFIILVFITHTSAKLVALCQWVAAAVFTVGACVAVTYLGNHKVFY